MAARVGRRVTGRGRPSLPPLPLASMKNMEMIFLLSFFKSENGAIGGGGEGGDGEDGWTTPSLSLASLGGWMRRRRKNAAK